MSQIPKSVTIKLTAKQRSQIKNLTGEEHQEVKFESEPLPGMTAPRRAFGSKPGGKLAVRTGSKLAVRTGSKLAVRTGSKLAVRTGSKLAVRTGSKLLAGRTGAKIVR